MADSAAAFHVASCASTPDYELLLWDLEPGQSVSAIVVGPGQTTADHYVVAVPSET